MELPAAPPRSIARDSWRIAAIAVVLTRVVAMTIAWGATWLLSTGTGGPDTGFLDIWKRWDAVHILGIAEYGYSAPESDAHATEWWPGFPLLVRVVMGTGLGSLGAGMLVSSIAMLVAFAYLYRLAEEEFGAGTRAVTYLALFPTGVFLVAPYTETLFLAGAIPAFYYARQKRWGLVAVPAAAAMSSRLPGAFVLIGLGVEFLSQRGFSRRRFVTASVALALGTVPFIGYAVFLANARGDPLYFLVDAEEGWGRHLVDPISALRTTLNLSHSGAETNWILAWRLEVVASAAMVALVVWALTKREWGYAAFMGTLTGVLLCTTWYFSHPRMLVMFFPSTLFVAAFTAKRPVLDQVLVPVLATVWTLGVIVYTRGAWFF